MVFSGYEEWVSLMEVTMICIRTAVVSQRNEICSAQCMAWELAVMKVQWD